MIEHAKALYVAGDIEIDEFERLVWAHLALDARRPGFGPSEYGVYAESAFYARLRAREEEYLQLQTLVRFAPTTVITDEPGQVIPVAGDPRRRARLNPANPYSAYVATLAGAA